MVDFKRHLSRPVGGSSMHTLTPAQIEQRRQAGIASARARKHGPHVPWNETHYGLRVGQGVNLYPPAHNEFVTYRGRVVKLTRQAVHVQLEPTPKGRRPVIIKTHPMTGSLGRSRMYKRY